MSQDPWYVRLFTLFLAADLATQLCILLSVVIILPSAWLLTLWVKRRWSYEEKLGALQAEKAHAATAGKSDGAPSLAPIAVAISSFNPRPGKEGIPCDQVLSFVDRFDGRFIRDDKLWRIEILPSLEALFSELRKLGRTIHLRLDAHSTIAFACGALLDVKSGLSLQVEQRGDRGIEEWVPTSSRDERSLPGVVASTVHSGTGGAVAIALSISQSVTADVRAYVGNALPDVGRIITIMPEGGPGQGRVIDGDHAARLADAIAAEINEVRGAMGKGCIHLFTSAPNSLLVALGRRSLSFGHLQLYEFDFQRTRTGTYMPSLELGTPLITAKGTELPMAVQ